MIIWSVSLIHTVAMMHSESRIQYLLRKGGGPSNTNACSLFYMHVFNCLARTNLALGDYCVEAASTVNIISHVIILPRLLNRSSSLTHHPVHSTPANPTYYNARQRSPTSVPPLLPLPPPVSPCNSSSSPLRWSRDFFDTHSTLVFPASPRRLLPQRTSLV